MCKIAICDDEIDCAKAVAKVLEKEFTKKAFNVTISIVTDKQDVIYEAIKKNEIDLLILDIDFKNGGKNGLEFAKDLRAINKNFYLVFLTAHLRYMHLSFIYKTFDYLVKPLNRNVIDDFTNRIIEECTIQNNKYLKLTQSIVLKISNIVYIEKIKNKSYFYMFHDNMVYSCNITLEKLLNLLPDNFIKCHRSYIVNKDFISCINNKKSVIIFENGLKCPINSYFRLEE